jgi:hypothetical protein
MKSNEKKPKATVASFMRDLISRKKTNEQVFAAARKAFGAKVITDAKKGYPAWYRAQMKRDAKKGAKR